MCRKKLYCVLCQPLIDSMLIESLTYIHDTVLFTEYLFSPSFTGFFPGMSQYFCLYYVISFLFLLLGFSPA